MVDRKENQLQIKENDFKLKSKELNGRKMD